MSAWELRGLWKRYPRGLWGGQGAPALRGVDLRVEPGERVALIGESGSGKSTLARVGLGLSPYDGGSISLFGEDTQGWTSARWRAARRDAQLLFQDPAASLHPGLRLCDLLRESARLHRPDEDPVRATARALDAVALGDRGEALPHQLSGGEQRRVTIARLLLAKPRLLVADEPTAGLDAALKASLIDLLLEAVGPRCAVVLISHDVAVVSWCCERVVVLDEGAVIESLPVRSLPTGARHPRTQALLEASGFGGAAREEAG